MASDYNCKQFVNHKIQRLAGHENAGYVKEQLAYLRRGIGKELGESPQVWAFILEDLPEEKHSRSGKPSTDETAIYVALTYFALHQQGHDIVGNPMHKNDGDSLAQALAKLVRSDEDLKRTKRRFDMLITANTIDELVYHLRGVIQMLKAKDIAIDYGRFANDLRLIQNPEKTNRIKLRWGEEFYSALMHKSDEREQQQNEVTEK